MNTKLDRKERSHQTILDSAARLLREKGVSGARVMDVMKGAGLTVGGFYAHFDSKESLIDETLRRTAAAMRESLFAKLDDKPASDRAEVVLKRYLSAGHRDARDVGCPFPAVTGEIGATAVEHREVLGEQVASLARELEHHVSAAQGVTARQLTLGLIALMFGGLTLARATAGSALSDELLGACRALGQLALRQRDDQSQVKA